MKIFEKQTSYKNMDKRTTEKREKVAKEEEDQNCLLDRKQPKKSFFKSMTKKVTNDFFTLKPFQPKEFSVANPVRIPKNAQFSITDPTRTNTVTKF